jgi:lipopolysaccharide transport system ATP-binding protein
MSDVMIRVENLGKKYMIGHQAEGRSNYVALRDVLADGAKSLVKRFTGRDKGDRQTEEEFWALKDVSFEVKRGECVGIIGRNGAGKSTLLKILSRITEPTTGRVELHGRVASLLEVGTGFHPELTGRENIYLNGAILGMTRAEIKKKFDEIVDFAEVERFLDMPVKRYSSGMYVRLAFAVAAHLEPEILVVDEVLAVGDAAFQKKCLGKMGDVATKEGRTVLFVSHNMGAVIQLCSKSIVVEKGKMKFIGDTNLGIDQYINSQDNRSGYLNLNNYKIRKGNQKIVFQWIKICNITNDICWDFSVGDAIKIVFKVVSIEELNFKLAIEIKSSDGIALCNMIDTDSAFEPRQIKGSDIYTVIMDDVRLYPDTYYLSFWVGSKDSHDTYDYLQDCLKFRIIDGGRLTMRHLPRSAGLFFLTPNWRLENKAKNKIKSQKYTKKT